MVLAINTLVFAAGVLALQFTPHLIDSSWLFLLPICLFFIFYHSPYSRVFIFVLGFLWALLLAHSYFYYQLPKNLISQDLFIEGQIASVVQADKRSQRFEFIVDKQINRNTSHFPQKIRLSWYHAPVHLKAGQYWRFKVRLKPPHGFRNPNGFDYERWLYNRGIQATGYIRRSNENKLLTQFSTLNYWRQDLFAKIKAVSRPFNGVLAALMVGEKSAITTSQWQIFRNTGTSHLMAISGLHIGLVAAFIFFLAQKICPYKLLRYFSSQQFAAVLALFAAFLYALLAGFSVPTQRALVMISVLMGAIIFKRSLQLGQALSLALLAVLIFDPRAILSSGFYLSFLAVAAIAYGVYGRMGHFPRTIQIIQMQWRLALFLLPVSFYWFQQASIISPLANIILVPWVSLLVVPLTLLSILFIHWLPALAYVLLNAADFLLALMWPFLTALSELPLSHLSLAPPTGWQMVLSLFGLLLLFAPKGFPLRWLGILGLLPLFLVNPKILDKDSFSIGLLDVGQGLSVVVQTRHHALLFDSGAAFSASFNAGDRVILPYLQQRGITQLDMMLISHGDRDHIGGAQAIINNMPVWQLMGQGIKVLQHPRKKACKQGQSWLWDGVLFEILHPDKTYTKRNNHACVLKISSASHSVLLTGDIEKIVEQRLLRDMSKKIDVDVLVVPHHGSNTSSSRTFIAATSPQIALVSAGFANRFKHPRPAVVAAYKAADIRFYNTAREGAIELYFRPDNSITPHFERRASQHYWQH